MSPQVSLAIPPDFRPCISKQIDYHCISPSANRKVYDSLPGSHSPIKQRRGDPSVPCVTSRCMHAQFQGHSNPPQFTPEEFHPLIHTSLFRSSCQLMVEAMQIYVESLTLTTPQQEPASNNLDGADQAPSSARSHTCTWTTDRSGSIGAALKPQYLETRHDRLYWDQVDVVESFLSATLRRALPTASSHSSTPGPNHGMSHFVSARPARDTSSAQTQA